MWSKTSGGAETDSSQNSAVNIRTLRLATVDHWRDFWMIVDLLLTLFANVFHSRSCHRRWICSKRWSLNKEVRWKRKVHFKATGIGCLTTASQAKHKTPWTVLFFLGYFLKFFFCFGWINWCFFLFSLSHICPSSIFSHTFKKGEGGQEKPRVKESRKVLFSLILACDRCQSAVTAADTSNEVWRAVM